MSSQLEEHIAKGQFAITAELVPPLSANPQHVLDEVAPIAERVSAINVTDAAAAKATLGSLGACAVMAQHGIEAVLQMTCRDRNRIALISDLLSASALGIKNVLTLTGDDPSKGDMPETKPVFDLNSGELLALATAMREEGKLPSGRECAAAPHFFLGTTDVPIDPSEDWKPAGLIAKSALGAQFVQTQFAYDTELTQRYIDALKAHGMTDKLGIIIGVGPILSAKSAQWMNDNLYGVNVPSAVIQSLSDAANPKDKGLRLCAELIETYSQMDGVAGVHIMAPAQKASAIGATLDMING